jgi:transcriptional regulator with XRE-family HTH domain
MLNHHEKQSIAQRLQALATNLETRMHAYGMTEDALASASGVSPRTVGNFLRPSNRKTPRGTRGTSKSFPSGTLSNFFKIAIALDVDPAVLLCSTDSNARATFYAKITKAIEAAYVERRDAEG